MTQQHRQVSCRARARQGLERQLSNEKLDENLASSPDGWSPLVWGICVVQWAIALLSNQGQPLSFLEVEEFASPRLLHDSLGGRT